MAFAGTRTRGSACGCCAEPDCTIASDDFNRADSGTVSGWTEVLAEWAIESNQLRGSAARALIVNDTAHPDGASGSLRANVKLTPDFTAGNNTSRLDVAYTDVDNYLFAEVRLIDAGCCEFQLGKRVAGVESWLTEESALPDWTQDEAMHLYACWQPAYDSSTPVGRFQAYVQRTTSNATEWPTRIFLEAEVDASGTKVGLEVTAGETLFDDFFFKYHQADDTHPDCPTCTTGCIVFGDSFASALSSCLWNQVSGSWSTSGGELLIPATGVLIALRPDPRVSGGIRAVATFNPATTSDKLQIIVDYLDASNYHFAEIQPGASNGTLKLFKRSGGSNTQIGSTATVTGLTTSTLPTLAVCWDGTVLQATVYLLGVAVQGLDRVTTAHGGKFAGIGSGAGSGATADNFGITILQDGCDDCPDAGTCCICLDQSAPKYLKLVVSGIVNDTCAECTELNGTYICELSASTCHIEQTFPACPFSGLEDHHICTWTGSYLAFTTCFEPGGTGIFAYIHLVKHTTTSEYWVVAQLAGPAIQDPSYAGGDSYMTWSKSLGVLSTAPDCPDVLDGIDLDWLCEAWPDGDYCDSTAGTAHVELP